MDEYEHDQIIKTTLPLANLPPGTEYLTVGQMPKDFVNTVLMRAFTDYSVALALDRNGYFPLGTGVLVERDGRHGILTARHCLHACSPEVRLGSEHGDTLWLVLDRGRAVRVEPQEVREHVLTAPTSDEFGPDLTFIEILAPERLGTFKAIGTFWSLNRTPMDVMRQFGNFLTPIATAGFPGVHHNTVRDGNMIRQQIKHMIYYNAIGKNDVHEKDGWDYLDTRILYANNPGLPASFAGVSGGPVWGMELHRDKGDGQISIRKHALVGITFYETYRKGDEGWLRAHFIKSIYDLAWKNLA